MAAIMIVVCLVAMIGGPYGLRRDHEVNRQNAEMRYEQLERTAQPEEEQQKP